MLSLKADVFIVNGDWLYHGFSKEIKNIVLYLVENRLYSVHHAIWVHISRVNSVRGTLHKGGYSAVQSSKS